MGAAPAQRCVRHTLHHFLTQTVLVLAQDIKDGHGTATVFHSSGWGTTLVQGSFPTCWFGRLVASEIPVPLPEGVGRLSLLLLLQDPACCCVGQLAGTAGRR